MSTGKTYSTKYLLDSNNNRGTEGQILSTTSTGIDWVDANSVPGTGLWVTSGNNIYNSNSGNVGIKTTSPANPLSINFAPNGISSITTSNNSTAWNTSSAIMLEGASNSNGLGFGVSGTANDRKSWIQSGHPDQQYASSLGTLAINPLGGNVGIGTTSPLAKLHAKSGDSGVSSVDTGTSAIIESDTTNYLRFLNPDSANAGLVWTSPSDNFAAYLRWKYSSRVLEMATAKTNSSISFSTGNADERMRITSAGNVGIGTTSPGSRLTVSGTNNATSEITLINTNPSTDNDWSITPFYNDQTLRFRTNSAATTVMTLKDNGNVGIGTTSPSQKLTVVGNTYISSGLLLLDNNQDIRWGDAGERITGNNTNGLVFTTNNLEAMRINSAGNVGIGTTSPNQDGFGSSATVLSIKAKTQGGSANTELIGLGNNDNDQVGMLGFMSQSATSPLATIRALRHTSDTSGKLTFDTAGSEKMRIDSSGVIKFNAYDGTNNTGSPTHILGTDASGNVVKSTAGSSIGPWLPLAGGTMTGVTQFNDHTNYGDQVYARFGASQDLQIFHNGTDSFIDNYTGSLTIRNRQDDGHIVFTCDDGSGGLASYLTLNGNNTHAYFTNPGNVGIGTTSPNVPLEVHGADITTRANTTAQSVLRLVRDVTDSNYTSTKDSAVDFMLSRQQTVNNNLPYTRLDIRLAGTTDSSTPSLDVMSLLHNGNVGIGTTSPNEKLHVAGNIHAFDTSADRALFASTAAGSTTIAVRSSGITHFNGGNVGIGTTSPVTNLQIASTGTPTLPNASGTALSTGSRLRLSSVGGPSATLDIGIGTGGKSWLQSRDVTDLSINYPFLINPNGGNVGIGTTSPSKKLTVYGGNDNGIWVDSSGSQYTSIAWGNNGTEKANIAYDNTNANFVLSAYGASDTVFSNNGSEKMRIDSAGNVGIGTTSPQSGGGSAKWLSLNGTAAYSGGIVYTVNSATKAYSYFESDYLKQQAQSGFGQKFIVNGTTTAMTILSDGNATFSGNVAVNGTNVTVANASNPYIYINDTNAGAGIFQQEGNTTRIGSDSNTQVVLVQNNATAVTIDTDKNVGIGTTSPSTKLEVTGHVTINSPAGASQTSYGLRLRKTNSSSAVQAGGEILASVYPPNTNAANLIFKTANASANLTQRMVIDGIGNVGIGTTSPSAGRKLDVHGDIELTEDLFIGATGSSRSEHKIKIGQNRSGNGYAYIDMIGDAAATSFYNLRIIRHNSGANALSQIIHTGTGNFEIKASDGGDIILNSSGSIGISQTSPSYKLDVTGDGRFTSTVTAANFILSSDERLKENVEKVCDNKVEVDWKTFELKTEKGQKRYGVIAQELEKTNPEFVREDSQGFKSVAYIDLLIAKIAELEARLEKLEK